MELNDSMKRFIAGIPGPEGWWKRRGENEFHLVASVLSEKGVSEETIKMVLQTTFDAAAEEFGR